MSELREALEKAIDSADDTEEVEGVEPVSEDTPDADFTQTDTGEQTDSVEGDEDTEVETEEIQETTEATEQVEKIKASEAAKPNLKAPIDWSPKEREDWSKVPKHLQEKILSRERDISNTMQNVSEARATHDRMTQLAQSYAPILAAEGAESPMQAVESLFRTTATLRMGSMQQKAQTIAGLINHYGVDINTLDSMLVGESPSPEVQQNSALEQMLNQRLAPLDDLVNQLNQNRQQQNQAAQTQAANDVQAFAEKAEFLADVRMDMADLIDMAAKRGVDMGLEEAYEKACTLNPQVQSVLKQRREQAALEGNNRNLANKRAAASSLHGRMGGTGGAENPNNMSLRDSISAAWDSQE